MQVNIPKISFIGVGSLKCGSRSVYEMLVQNKNISTLYAEKDNIYTRPKKESWFFKKEYINYYEYEKLFNTNGGIFGEWTSDYILSDKYLGRIKLYNKDIKILYIVRNPIDRIWSHYNMKSNLKSDSIILKDHLEFKQDLIVPILDTNEELFDLKRLLFYSSYASHIKRLYSIFPSENVHIIKLEDVAENQQLTINNIESFLGVELNSNIHNIHKLKTVKRKDQQELLDSIELIKRKLTNEMEEFYNITGINYVMGV
jgi:hypothetical protein